MRLSNGLNVGARLLAVGVLLASPVRAQSATQVIHMDIRPISRIAVAGTTTFTIPARTRADASSVSSAAASYAVTTNEENRRISVALDAPMPAGVQLRMRMDAPAGASAEDDLTLSTAPQTAVTGISRLNAKDLAIVYSLIMDGGAVVPAATTRTVRVTLVSGV